MLCENDDITADSKHNHTMKRLAAHLNDGSVDLFPAYELEAILHALANECNRARDPPPLKRARGRPANNNLHSILKFVERVIRQRYVKRSKCRNAEDDDFLDDELKRYFGARDLSFRIEEDILSLAFEIAMDAVVQRVADVVPNTSTSTDDGITSDKDQNLPPVQSIIGNNLHSDGIIKTALQIIDSAVLISRRLKAKLDKLQQAQRERQNLSNANITDKRKKYEHLLKPTKQRHCTGQQHAKDPATTCVGVISIMEENYPQQWDWFCRLRTTIEEQTLASQPAATSASCVDMNFVIVRRRIETLDDISLSSADSDDEMHEDSGMSITIKRELYPCDLLKPDTKEDPSNPIPKPESELAHAASNEPTPNMVEPVSPLEQLDLETYQLRLVLLDMPPSESSSAEVGRHTVGEIVALLGRYGELDGAAGITRCGDILGGGITIDAGPVEIDDMDPRRTAIINRFPLNDATVSSLATAFLTDATGALRANAFLRSFVLPLMIEMNPIARAIAAGTAVCDENVASDQGKPASRSLTSLLATLSRERPMECVVSVLIPSLTMTKCIPSIASSESMSSFEPTRFQCELVSSVLRGKDALSVPAIALLVGGVMPTKEEIGTDASSPLPGMKWTESTMPVLTACLNHRPSLPDDVVAALADGISRRLSPNAPASMTRSIKFSTLFHTFVARYGSQVKSARMVEPLLDSAARLRTFMSKSICLALKKLS
ncbi:hypothetical protein ACHAW5_005855 [Stephanodiscus triporus]|uniref:Fanconi Anaemia group E protein C-terminal domain-containing protein n=1 Tax=Stephanodiscus triporus TaxID=2934178 RepID=A0ABD3N1M5_9STRA